MSTGILTWGPPGSRSKYLPEIHTGFGALSGASRLAGRIRELLPARQESASHLADDAPPVGENVYAWTEMVRRANAAIVTTLIEVSNLSSTNDSTLPVTLPMIDQLSGVSRVFDNPFMEVRVCEEPADFHWSAEHYRVFQLVREISEETHANY